MADLPSSAYQYVSSDAFYGANAADVKAQGWEPFGYGTYRKAMPPKPGATGPNLPGSGGGGPNFGTFNTTMPGGPPPKLDPYKPDDKGGTSSTGSGANGGSGGGPGTGPAGGGAGSSPALSALRSQAGMGSGGGGGLGVPVYGASYGDVAAPDLGSAPNDQAAPVAPTTASAPPPDIATGQALAAPGAMRQNIGQRIPPSLAALLHPKVY